MNFFKVNSKHSERCRYNKCLLIWPPLYISNDLPLGIPSLVGYLKEKGLTGIEVFDANIVYIKENPTGWILCNCRKAISLFEKKLPKYSSLYSGAGYHSKVREFSFQLTSLWKIFRKIYSRINKLINKIIQLFLFLLKRKEEKNIDWSLKELIDYAFKKTHLYHKCEKIVKRFMDINYEVIGISVIYPFQITFAIILARIIKSIDENIFIILGGSQINKGFNHFIKNKKLEGIIDGYIVGEAEEPLYQLLKRFPIGNENKIPNFFFHLRDRKTTESIDTKNCFSISDNEFSIPDFSGFEFDNYDSFFRMSLPILASRGCWWGKCSFCTCPLMKSYEHRQISVEKVLGMIKELKSCWGISSFSFVDDNLSPAFLKEFSGALSKLNLKINWRGHVGLSHSLLESKLSRSLAESGCRSIATGLESVEPRILRLMNKSHKNFKTEEIKRILKLFKQNQISTYLHVMLGFPTETYEEAEKTLDFLIQNKSIYDYVILHKFHLEEDTPVYLCPEKYGISKIGKVHRTAKERLSFRYETINGKGEEENLVFVKNVKKRLRKSGVKIAPSFFSYLLLQ